MGKNQNETKAALSLPLPRRVALWLTEQEADAFLTLLLHAPEVADVSEEISHDLLRRVAELQQSFAQEAETSTNGTPPCLCRK